MASSTSGLALSLIAVSCQLLRLSVELIQKASQKTAKDFKEDHHNATAKSTKKPLGENEKSYGSIASSDEEVEHLLDEQTSSPLPSSMLSTLSFRIQISIAILLSIVVVFKVGVMFPSSIHWTGFCVVALGLILTASDRLRQRFGTFHRVLCSLSMIALWLPIYSWYFGDKAVATGGDKMFFVLVSLYVILNLVESVFLPKSPESNQEVELSPGSRKSLSRLAMFRLLKPYFWPDATGSSAFSNRLRAIMTWVCVILSKICNLASPLLLGWASTALAHEDYGSTIKYTILYSAIQFFGAAFKEGQSLVYLKVAQAAFVQLSETTFAHLHSLSLDWHLRKKLGEVIRSMDRGISACDTLMKYMFLWLVPAMAECIVVCIIFASYFNYLPMAMAVFYFVWLYIVWTVVLTLWRKKFRKAVVKSDNEFHDRCTDSLLNFDTVKYFTAEDFECQRYGDSVKEYQKGSVNVQASLSVLNISQKLILQICLATALSLATMGIKERIDCCIDHGCDSGVSDCCQSIDVITCPGMQVGDFIAVLTYVLQLFQPLNFLGSVYNAVVMAIIDLKNLSELLAETPDVKDAPDALALPESNEDDPDIAVEFDNVVFRYPTQAENKGLKGVSFKMKRGTTTAVVGPTGAGKTTLSRLFFRFYDVLGGAVKVNGKDVRSVSQKSLRGAIGVVPQNACMFNDTIRANLLYGRRDASQEEVELAAKDAQLLDFIAGLEEGWETMVGEMGLKLSGGEKQRAAIARCLLKDPPFVLLDEATSALDTLTENSIQEALDRLGNQRTVLVIAHRLGTIRNADNILVLKDGKVAEEGTHDQLLDLDGVYAEMWKMQLHTNTGSQGSLSALDN